MKFTLIEQNTSETIGQINLEYLPRTKEFIEFGNHIYGIVRIIHSESEIKLRLFNTENESETIMVEWED